LFHGSGMATESVALVGCSALNFVDSAHREQIADIVRQAVLPFEQTTAHVLWLAADHLHLYIDATPDYPYNAT
jgi:hypothetical protein